MNLRHSYISTLVLSLFANPACTVTQDLGTSERPVPMETRRGVRVLSLGGQHACAVIENGALRCWGKNDFGQVGLKPEEGDDCEGTPCHQDHPRTIANVSEPVDLALGSRHSCARAQDGELKCWGANHFGQLGRGAYDADAHEAPQRPLNAHTATRVVAGAYHTCVLDSNGAATCFGLGSLGQLGADPRLLDGCNVSTDLDELGAGDKSCESRGVSFGVSEPILEIVAGGFATCARTTQGWYCAGRNDFGQLGRGYSSEYEWEPAPPQFEGNVTHVALSAFHSCFTSESGTAWCNGDPSLGRLGIGSSPGENCVSGPCVAEPVPVQNLDNVESTALGADFSCTLLDTESTRCFGSDERGQLGNSQAPLGTCPREDGDVDCSLSPVEPYQLSLSIELHAGEDFACTLSTEGRVYCWGDNRLGQLSQGRTTTMAAFPTEAYGLVP
jgi:alpha-tubulin suppressor-like RCC1 family protein